MTVKSGEVSSDDLPQGGIVCNGSHAPPNIWGNTLQGKCFGIRVTPPAGGQAPVVQGNILTRAVVDERHTPMLTPALHK